MKIGSPGCDRSGASQSVGLPLNTLAAFSSPGPLRNNAKKPDVTAPGAMIISALSADSTPEPVFLVADPHSVVAAGTSMASPFVAGVVALLLQSNPALTSAAVKQQLKAASRIPGKAAGTLLAIGGSVF